ncbi:MAG: hypothetical protein R3C49_07885 [Planctomycetaceae bacterium]
MFTAVIILWMSSICWEIWQVIPLEDLVNSNVRPLSAGPNSRLCRRIAGNAKSCSNGECPKNRFLRTPDGDDGLNYLCAGYRSFFNHSRPALQQMAALIKAGKPPSRVMQHRRRLMRDASRNRSDSDEKILRNVISRGNFAAKSDVPFFRQAACVQCPADVSEFVLAGLTRV